MSQRFRDRGESVYDLWDHWIVPCPSCKKPVDLTSRKLSCIHCGYSKVFSEEGTWVKLVPVSVPMEDYLTIPCCGHMLWAVNLEHLDFLEQYVGAQLRERQANVNKSMASRLPQWIKDRKNRQEILACITKLRDRLTANGYQPNPALRRP
jgi:hypothetical protein